MHEKGESLFLLGIGNTLRGDDGIGTYVCRELSCLPLINVDISFALELHTDWLEIFSGFDVVIIVDAAVDGPDEVRLERVLPDTRLPSRSSHYLDPGTLAALMSELFHPRPVLYTCSVPGYDFGIGEGLGQKARVKAGEAVEILRHWLTENGYLRGD